MPYSIDAQSNLYIENKTKLVMNCIKRSYRAMVLKAEEHQNQLDSTKQTPWTLSRKFSGGPVGAGCSWVTCVILKPNLATTAWNFRGGGDDQEFGEGRIVRIREYLLGRNYSKKSQEALS